LIFGLIYAAAAIAAKLIGCGGPALLFGFNVKGALRLGLGMAPRGEFTLIIAGIGLAMGILDQQLFAVLVLMILITTLVIPPFLTLMLKLSGPGTRKPVKSDDKESMTWEFHSEAVADIVVNTLFEDLRKEGFYVQVMNFDKGLCQARKDDVSLYIRENDNAVTIETAKSDMHFVKTVVYEVIVDLHEAIQRLKDFSDPQEMKKELLVDSDQHDSAGKTSKDLFSYFTPECVLTKLEGETKDEIITELVDVLNINGRLLHRDIVLMDVIQREQIMSTGMEHGIALPHAKSDGVEDLVIAIGLRKEGIDFGSLDGEKSRLFILMVSPKKASTPHIQFLASISSLLRENNLYEDLINAESPQMVVELLQKKTKNGG
jgi:fructose-specific phosphotransferase system IIA component